MKGGFALVAQEPELTDSVRRRAPSGYWLFITVMVAVMFLLAVFILCAVGSRANPVPIGRNTHVFHMAESDIMAIATPTVVVTYFEMEATDRGVMFTVDGLCDDPTIMFAFLNRLKRAGCFKDVNTKAVEPDNIHAQNCRTKFTLQGRYKR